MDRIKLGILQVNHDKSIEVGDAHPDDAHRFRDLFDTLDQRFTYRVYMTIGGELPADVNEQDAYLITGSPLSVLDNPPFLEPLLSFIRDCDHAKKPMLGTCFGHQAIALALGGKVGRSKAGFNLGVEHTQFVAKRPYMDPPLEALPFYVFHEDQVLGVPPGCDLLGTTNACPVSSFGKGNHIFTTQSHPEFTDRFMRCVMGFYEPKMPAQDYAAALSSLETTPRGDVFAQWASTFFKGEHQ